MFTQQALEPKLSRLMFDKLCRKRWSSWKHTQNGDSDNDGSRTVSGSEFRKVGPETAKLLCPYLIALERPDEDICKSVHMCFLLNIKTH